MSINRIMGATGPVFIGKGEQPASGIDGLLGRANIELPAGINGAGAAISTGKRIVTGDITAPLAEAQRVLGGQVGLTGTGTALTTVDGYPLGIASRIGGQPLDLLAGATDPDEIVVNGRQRDFRARLSALNTSSAQTQVYGPRGPNNILDVLHDTRGVLFPYTPTIAFSQGVDYRSLEPVHSNYELLSYSRTPAVDLSVTGKFSVQNQREGEYALAVLHFLRVVSKMYFGEEDAATKKAGLPPPVLLFNAYGNMMFNNVRVVLKSHSYSFDDTVDLIPIELRNGMGRAVIPALFTIQMQLGVIQSPRAQRKEFSLDAFRTGALLRDGGWL